MISDRRGVRGSALVFPSRVPPFPVQCWLQELLPLSGARHSYQNSHWCTARERFLQTSVK
jgi:hypothetical protein